MRQALLNDYLYIVITALFTVVSQLLIKHRLTTENTNIPISIYDKISFFVKILIDPVVLLAIFFIFASGISWMIAMTKFELSKAYPIVISLLITFTSISSIVLFKEEVNLYKIVGILVILIGVYALIKGN